MTDDQDQEIITLERECEFRFEVGDPNNSESASGIYTSYTFIIHAHYNYRHNINIKISQRNTTQPQT